MKPTYKILPLALLLSIAPTALQAMDDQAQVLTLDTKQQPEDSAILAQEQHIGSLVQSLEKAQTEKAGFDEKYSRAKAATLTALENELAIKNREKTDAEEEIGHHQERLQEAQQQMLEIKQQSLADANNAYSDHARNLAENHANVGDAAARLAELYEENPDDTNIIQTALAERLAFVHTAHVELVNRLNELDAEKEASEAVEIRQQRIHETFLANYQAEERYLTGAIAAISTKLEQLRDADVTDKETLVDLLAHKAKYETEVTELKKAQEDAIAQLEYLKKPSMFSRLFGGSKPAAQTPAVDTEVAE